MSIELINVQADSVYDTIKHCIVQHFRWNVFAACRTNHNAHALRKRTELSSNNAITGALVLQHDITPLAGGDWSAHCGRAHNANRAMRRPSSYDVSSIELRIMTPAATRPVVSDNHAWGPKILMGPTRSIVHTPRGALSWRPAMFR